MSASTYREPTVITRAMGKVARDLIGEEPTTETDDELKFGTRGSLSIDLNAGTWFDFEAGAGGGVLDFVMQRRSTDKAGAIAWLQERKHIPPPSGLNIVARYPYTDKDGALLFEVCRLDPKDFRQRSPDGAGGWIWKMKGVGRVIYRLPSVLAAVAAGQTIYVTEGEKAADALAKLGVVATCSPGGANKWRDGYALPLVGANVVILPDNDDPGRQHGAMVAKSLRRADSRAASVQVLPLPGLPDKGDAFDWIAAGGTAAELAALVDDMLEADEAATPASAPATDADPATCELILNSGAPLASARQFLLRGHTRYGTRTLHHQNGTFYSWGDSHYTELAPEEMRERLYRFLDGAKRINDRNEVVPFDPTKNKVANVLEATAAEAQLARRIGAPAWLGSGTNPPAGEMIACGNVLLHLPTRNTLPHTPNFFTLNALAFPFDAKAPAPSKWLAFLKSIWPDDDDAIETLQEMFGLCLTGETKHQKAFLIVGPKRSGKDTIARVLTELLGAANVAGPTLSSLSQNFGLAPLIGKRVAIISDARLSGKADQQVIVERLLSITGEDGLTIDRKFRDGWTGKLDARFVILTNEMPRLTDSSGALSGRFIILTMTRSFYGKEDLGLSVRLMDELPGILLWAIEGWERLAKRGYFIAPASSEAAQREMDDLGSPVGAFLRECCTVGSEHEVQKEALYRAWCRWCGEQGREHPGNAASFGRDLTAAIAGLKTIQRRIGGEVPRFYSGVRLIAAKASQDVTCDTALQPQLDPYFSDDPGPLP